VRDSRLTLQSARVLALSVTERRREDGNFSADERKSLADRIPSLKDELAQISRHLLQLQTQESHLANQLSAEQNRWVEFNDRLDALERSLPGVR
jgi:predicted  nucleic acid-binding Zn-ribbon protein